MREKCFRLLLLMFVLLPIRAAAQDLVLEDYTHSSNTYLNTQIFADTSSAEFKNGTRTYVLKKDGIYLCNAVLAFTNKVLRIRSEYGGTGYYGANYKPTIYLYPTATGNPPGYLADVAGGAVHLKNLLISGYYEPVDSNLDRQQGGIVRLNTSGSGGSVYVDSCIVKSINGNAIRTEGKPSTIRISNSIFADMGFLGNSNFGAGKAIDLRDQDVDTCDVQNSTFVNFVDRVIRHYQSVKGPIRNFIFNHNTVVNSLSFHGFLALGRVDSSGNGILQIKNNLLVDHFALGGDTSYVRQAEFGDPGELDPVNGKPRIAWILANPNVAAKWDISNNYYAVSDSGNAMFNMTSPVGPLAKNAGPPLTWGINTRLAALGKDSTAAFKQVSVKLAKTPGLMTGMIRWFFTPRAEGGAGKLKNTNDANYTKITAGNWKFDYLRHKVEYYADTLNCRVSASAATVAQLVTSDGKTVGDPRWGSVVTSIDESAQLPGVFSLEQNYPNPFNPTTEIRFSLPLNGSVSLKVYDVLGREVATLIDGVMEAGAHTATWSASRVSSGLYFYTLRSEQTSITKKMILLR